MQPAVISIAREPTRVARRSPTKATSPAPIIVPAPITVRYPEAIFGKLPAGFVLRDQHISILVHWHRKAMRAVNDLPANCSEAEMTAAMAVANEIFDAIKRARTTSSGMVAAQMLAIVERFQFMDNDDSIEEELNIREFKCLAEALVSATAMPPVTKRVGSLHRGRNLTRAGLLHRYHAFLIGEIQTLSLALYGSREYAMLMQPLDDAVNVRVRAGFKNGKYNPKARRICRFPFFDESTISARAKAVLGSLKIDTKHADELADRAKAARSRSAR
ncbi:hypothetical protein ACE10X_13075 [Bradyrhizobium sp. Pha-3]|uniref:hypothetical protein n=1 Tax=Bradyrhizobium sp. Pha-3 TaxID=208375 RepID=UPI0035D48133